MADEKKYTEHLIRGAVPVHEWRKFLQQHFAPGPIGEPKPIGGGGSIAESASGICGSLGCPSTYGGGTLHHCSVDVEADGSATIHCYYAAQENRQ
jgi:hypothetical protein